MTLITLHHAIHNAALAICNESNGRDDYMHATTAVLFKALWGVAPQTDYTDNLWNLSIGGDISGSWIAKAEESSAPRHQYLMLSSCNKSMVVAHDVRLGQYGIVRETAPHQILPTLGDTLRALIQSVIREGVFHGHPKTDPSAFPSGYADEIDPEVFKGPISEGYKLTGLHEVMHIKTDVYDPSKLSEQHGHCGGDWDECVQTSTCAKIAHINRNNPHNKAVVRAQPIDEANLPRDAEGNVADLTLDDTPIRLGK